MPATNAYQVRTSPRKLRGGYYTPEELARLVVRRLGIRAADLVVDPSCGDGSFLLAAHEEGAGRVIGLDVDPSAVARARERTASLRDVEVRQADVLASPSMGRELAAGRRPGRRLFVVGNPPYVEAKRLPRDVKRALAARFPDALDGAPDLYLYFLHVCLGWLRDVDRLAFVLPNKALVNANARRLREALLESRRLRAIWLATRAALFPGAAVYPVVLFAGAGGGDVEVTRLGREGGGDLRVESCSSIDPRLYGSTASRAFFVPPAEATLSGALARLLSSRERLRDVLDIRWTVSFHRAGLRERYVTRGRPDSPHARRFLGGGAFVGNGEVERHRLRWAGWWIRYDEEELSRIGNAVPSAETFRAGKVAICQNGRTLRAAFDEEGLVLKDTFLAGLPREGDHALSRHPRAVVGLLCSRATHFFYQHVFEGGHVGGGYLHFLRSFLVDVPIGEWTEAAAREADRLVRRLERGPDLAAEEEIERIASGALDLSAPERAAIERWAEGEPNWAARDRVRRPS